MKNLFDFATKELSQDAFLRWFISNYEDSKLENIVIDFLNEFTKGQNNGRKPLNLKVRDIVKIETYSQVNDIDVVIDIWSKSFNGHRTIVIEDKTTSKEHKQLVHYNKTIEKWKYGEMSPKECAYKIFYKTNRIDEEELLRVKEAGWTPFDIEKIYAFFSRYYNTGSDILDDYIKHICKLHNDYSFVSDEPAGKWNINNWDIFLKEYMKRDFPHIYCYTTTFRGMYYSLIFNYDLPNNQYLKCATLEIQVRSSLIPYLHPAFKTQNGIWRWSINQLKDNEDVYSIAYQELISLREHIEHSGSSLIKRGNTTRAFGNIKEKIAYKDMKADELWSHLKEWIKEYINVLDYMRK